MVFRGLYEHTIDAKGRISIPAEIRNSLDPQRDGRRLIVTPGDEPNNLFIFAEKQFDRLAEKAFDFELFADPDVFKAQQIMYSLAVPVDIDKQGRVTLPERHLRHAGISGDVWLVGAGDRLVLYKRGDFERMEEDYWREFSLRGERVRTVIERRASRRGD
jgi:MraZ protein